LRELFIAGKQVLETFRENVCRKVLVGAYLLKIKIQRDAIASFFYMFLTLKIILY
jgi:hypothetical protein